MPGGDGQLGNLIYPVGRRLVTELDQPSIDPPITVEIKAKRAEGFPSDVVRIVNENASQLKFDSGSGFEDE